MPRLTIVEDEISRKLTEAEQSGELRSAPSYGKPLEHDSGWDQAPEELRMSFKILKDSGFVPPEVEMFKQRAQLRALIAATDDLVEKEALVKNLSLLEQSISLRLESR